MVRSLLNSTQRCGRKVIPQRFWERKLACEQMLSLPKVAKRSKRLNDVCGGGGVGWGEFEPGDPHVLSCRGRRTRVLPWVYGKVGSWDQRKESGVNQVGEMSKHRGLATTCSPPLGSRKELWANGSLLLLQNIHQHKGSWEHTAVSVTRRQMWEWLGAR